MRDAFPRRTLPPTSLCKISIRTTQFRSTWFGQQARDASSCPLIQPISLATPLSGAFAECIMASGFTQQSRSGSSPLSVTGLINDTTCYPLFVEVNASR